MLQVQRITHDATWELRSCVLRPGYPIEDCHYPGDEQPETLHAGCMRDGILVGIASIYRDPRPLDDASTAWRVRGMATDPTARRLGVGTATLDACVQHVLEHGGTIVWCNARIEAIPFYDARGWRVIGGQFEIPDVGTHVVMERAL